MYADITILQLQCQEFFQRLLQDCEKAIAKTGQNIVANENSVLDIAQETAAKISHLSLNLEFCFFSKLIQNISF